MSALAGPYVSDSMQENEERIDLEVTGDEGIPSKGICSGSGRFAPTSSYTKLTISGWAVMVACGYKKYSQ